MLPTQLIIYSIIAWSLALFVIIHWIHYYRSHVTNHLVSMVTFLSWLLCLSIVILIPIDLVQTGSQTLNNLWTTCFWLAFVLSWIAIPVLSEMVVSGGFTWKQKIIYSMKTNFIYLMLALVIFLIGFIYLVAIKKIGINSLISLVMCMIQFVGVITLIMLVGIGLIYVPYDLWRQSDISQQVDQLYIQLVKANDDYCQVQTQMKYVYIYLSQVEQRLLNRKLICSELIIIKHAIEFDIQTRLELLSVDTERANNQTSRFPHDLTEISQTELMKIFRHCQETYHNWIQQQAINTNLRNSINKLNVLIGLDRWRYVYIIGYRLMAIISGLLTGLMLVDEFSLIVSHNSSLIYTIINAISFNNSIYLQLYCIFPLLYLTLCTYYPLFRLTYKRYHLSKHSTDDQTLLVNATWMLRVTTPLAYNFVMMLQINQTELENLIGQIQVIPFFGSSLNTIFPIFIVVVAIVTIGYLIYTNYGYQLSDDLITKDGINTMLMVINMMLIHGHFWVERRGGRIVDPLFQEYVDIARQHLPQVKTQHDFTLVYKKTNNNIKHKLTKVLNKMRQGYIIKKPSFGHCYDNSVLAIKQRRGNLRMGSLGMKCKRTGHIYWHYGHPKWTRSYQFILTPRNLDKSWRDFDRMQTSIPTKRKLKSIVNSNDLISKSIVNSNGLTSKLSYCEIM